MSIARFTPTQGKRIGYAIQDFEAHGRNRGILDDAGRPRTLANNSTSSSNITVSEHNISGTLDNHVGTRNQCGTMSLGPGLWQINANILIGSGGGTTVTSVTGWITASGTSSAFALGQVFIYLPLPTGSDGAGFNLPTGYLDNRTEAGTTPIYVMAGAVSSTNQAYDGHMSALKLA